MKRFFKKYSLLIMMSIFNILTFIFFPQTGQESLMFTGRNFINFLFMLTPIFICIGLLDVWVEKETMIKILGENSGLRGYILAFAMGMITAVPLYALLPIAGILLKKGSKISNILIFICSSASIRIPLLLFEVSSMGWKFTFIRFTSNIFVVIIIATMIDKLLTKKDKNAIYENVNNI
jgi:uncharacterized membrane protein YraQ (UPF0718 family)